MTGGVVEFGEDEATDAANQDRQRVFRYSDTTDYILYAIALTGAVAAGAALQLMTLVFGSSVSSFSNFATNQDGMTDFQDRINQMVLYLVYLFVGRLVVGYVATLCVCLAAARTTNKLRKAFLEHLLRQDISHFDLQGNRSVATQVTTNGNQVNQRITEKLYTFVLGISLFFSSYIIALAVQWKLALITLSVVPASLLVTGGAVKIYSRAASIAQDALGSMKTIQVFGGQSKIVNIYDRYLQDAHREGKKKSLSYGVLFGTGDFFSLGGTALAFWEGHRLFQAQEITSVGAVFTVVLSVTLGATSVLIILPQLQAFTNAASAAAVLFLTIDKPSLLDPLSPDVQAPENCRGHIEFRNLRFAYPSHPTELILNNLNLVIPAGKTTALVGMSGCGKSTLIGLLERWYQPNSGQILLDGQDIMQYNTEWLRQTIRLVQQELTLFQCTVFQNVANGFVGEQRELGKKNQMNPVQDACKASEAHSFIMKLPLGYHTELGECAHMLSGGQKQRLAIARSIISNPTILLCDEATSALDPKAERLVQDALTRVSFNKTTLVIAHKLATIMNADNIAVMVSGRVMEQGTHAQLLEKDGLYAAMVHAQDPGIGDEEDSQRSGDDLFSEENTDETLARPNSVERQQSATEQTRPAHDTSSTDGSGRLGYSLLKCVWIMLIEHPDLYKWYVVMVVVYLVLGGAYPAQALLFSRLINVFTVKDSEADHKANLYALLLFVVAIANFVGFFCIGLATNIVGQVLTYPCRLELLERMVNQDQSFFDHPENSSGSLTAKLSSVPSAIQELMSANAGRIVNIVVNILTTGVLGIVLGWKLGLTLAFTGITLIAGSGYVRVWLDQKLEASVDKQFARSANLAAETVTSVRTISLLTLDALLSMITRSLVITLIPYSFSQSADFLVLALGFWYGSRMVASTDYTVTQFFIIFIAVVFGNQAAAQFFTYTTLITKATGAANYLLWLPTMKASICENHENRDIGPVGDEIAVELDDKSHPRHVAHPRFYDPTSGCITLNGADVTRMSPVLLRKHLSHVEQECPLYLGSVRDNIAIGLDYEPSDKEVHDACQQANILDFVSSLPEGLNTPCGSRGLNLSGGQRQRIALARALIPSSSLDTHSERIVQEALDKAMSNRTTIAVAHRLSTIRHADVIFVIQDGMIAERGTHQELQQIRGIYHAMCLAQSLDQA
ncbi:ATP-binding cassette, subfamily B, member 1 [Xylariaceae sp. FL0255]|nr:ATP-binding cassette, subfamily B, member 1 [Xylariaceae sp. FL0255]